MAVSTTYAAVVVLGYNVGQLNTVYTDEVYCFTCICYLCQRCINSITETVCVDADFSSYSLIYKEYIYDRERGREGERETERETETDRQTERETEREWVLGYLWDPLDCCGTMADGRFLRGRGLNLHHLQYECLELLSIWEPSLYTLLYQLCEMCIMPSWGISETP